MWPFTPRRSEPTREGVEALAATLRDFLDTTGFSTGQGFGSTLTTSAALRKHGGWIGIAVRPVVDRIAGLQWQAVNDAGEEVEKAPILDLLRSPHAGCDGAMMLRITAQSLVLAGEAYLLKVRGRRSGKPVQLLPVSPDRVQRVAKDDGTIEYHVAPLRSGKPEVHSADDMIRIWRPLPSDPWEPYGVASMLVHEIGAEEAWRLSVRTWMERDARPQMALEFGDDIEHFFAAEGAVWEPLARVWRNSMRRAGGDAFNMPVPLPPGAKLKELSGLGETNNVGPTELALRSKILSALGVPPFLLGAAHEANRASAEASLWAFDFSAVRPWTELLVCAINHQLGPDFEGQRVQFRDWVWRDRLAESEIDSKLLEHFVISPNEARAKRNMPPAEWADFPVGQQQDVPFTGTPNVTDPPSERDARARAHKKES